MVRMSINCNSQLVSTFLFALTIGTVLTVMLRAPSPEPSSAVKTNTMPLPRRNHVANAFYLGVAITFPSNEDKETFIELFKPMAKYVEDYELGTLSYQLQQSDKDPLRVHVLERYKDKDYYLNVHKTSREFLAFRAELQKLFDKGAKVEGQSYIETDIGFI